MYTNNIPTANTVPEPSNITLNNDRGKYSSKNVSMANVTKLIATIIK